MILLHSIFFLMTRRPPISTRTDPLFPDRARCRSALADQRRRALQHPPTLVRPDAPPMAESPPRRVERAIEIVVGRMRHLGVHRSIGGIQYRFAVARAAGDPFAVDEQRGLRLITFSHRVLLPSVSSPSSHPAPPLRSAKSQTR